MVVLGGEELLEIANALLHIALKLVLIADILISGTLGH